MGGVTIRTDRLVLRPFALADEDTLFAIFRDDGVRRFLLDGHLVDRDWVRAEIEWSMRRFAEGGLGSSWRASQLAKSRSGSPASARSASHRSSSCSTAFIPRSGARDSPAR